MSQSPSSQDSGTPFCPLRDASPTSAAPWRCCRATTGLRALIAIYNARNPGSPYPSIAPSEGGEEPGKESPSEGPSTEGMNRAAIERLSQHSRNGTPVSFRELSVEVENQDVVVKTERPESEPAVGRRSVSVGTDWGKAENESYKEMVKNRGLGLIRPDQADATHPTVKPGNDPSSVGDNVIFAYQYPEFLECEHCGHRRCNECCVEKKPEEVVWVYKVKGVHKGEKKLGTVQVPDLRGSLSPAPSDVPVDWEEDEEVDGSSIILW